MSSSSLFVGRLFGGFTPFFFNHGEESLNRDTAVRDELPPSASNGGPKWCGPKVLVHQEPGGTTRIEWSRRRWWCRVCASATLATSSSLTDCLIPISVILARPRDPGITRLV